MITGLHLMVYSRKDEALTQFLRDKLRLPFRDGDDGWPLFEVSTADLGAYPTSERGDEPPSGWMLPMFRCDDIHTTVSELKSRGVKFTQGVEDDGSMLFTLFEAPGDLVWMLYQSYHPGG